MRSRVRIAVIVPAGPRDDVLDTLASVVHYTAASRVVVVVDDGSALTTSDNDRNLPGDIVVLPAPRELKGLSGDSGLSLPLVTGGYWKSTNLK